MGRTIYPTYVTSIEEDKYYYHTWVNTRNGYLVSVDFKVSKKDKEMGLATFKQCCKDVQTNYTPEEESPRCIKITEINESSSN